MRCLDIPLIFVGYYNFVTSLLFLYSFTFRLQ